jgi:hypothetical protein
LFVKQGLVYFINAKGYSWAYCRVKLKSGMRNKNDFIVVPILNLTIIFYSCFVFLLKESESIARFCCNWNNSSDQFLPFLLSMSVFFNLFFLVCGTLYVFKKFDSTLNWLKMTILRTLCNKTSLKSKWLQIWRHPWQLFAATWCAAAPRLGITDLCGIKWVVTGLPGLKKNKKGQIWP